MKKWTSYTILGFFVVILVSTPLSAGTYSGGSGIDIDPFIISEPNDWTELMNTSGDWGSCFSVGDDIDLAGRTVTPIGNSSTAFSGSFEGNNNTISNVTISQSANYAGLFGNVSSTGVVQNLSVVNGDIAGGYYTGGIVGTNNGTVTNCRYEGSIDASNYVGGLIGYNYGNVTGCSVCVSVVCVWYGGGLIGWNGSGDVTSCDVECSLTVDRDCGGGLIGKMTGGSVSNCTADFVIIGSGTYTGGLVGKNENGGEISDCSVMGEILQGGKYTGGLIGWNQGEDSDVTNCYAKAEVNAVSTHVGGLIGYNLYGTLTNCFAVGGVTGTGYVGGLVGYNSDGHTITCYAAGSVDTGGGDYAGGLVGYHYGYNKAGSISNCYAVGEINAGNYVGGLVGYNRYGRIYDSYTAGVATTTGSNVGSFCGYQHGSASVMQNCFWEGTGVGYTVNSSYPGTITNVMGLTSGEIRQEASFTSYGWDFASVWWINEGRDYPKLAYQPWGDVDNDCFVGLSDVAVLSCTWLASDGDANYNSVCELSGDTTVDDDDLAEMVSMWLEGPAW